MISTCCETEVLSLQNEIFLKEMEKKKQSAGGIGADRYLKISRRKKDRKTKLKINQKNGLVQRR
jgi:hypothetical protein